MRFHLGHTHAMIPWSYELSAMFTGPKGDRHIAATDAIVESLTRQTSLRFERHQREMELWVIRR